MIFHLHGGVIDTVQMKGNHISKNKFSFVKFFIHFIQIKIGKWFYNL